MAITYVGGDSAGGDSSTTTTLSLTLPTVSDDDFALLWYYSDGAGNTGIYAEVTTPTGWTLDSTQSNTGGRDRQTSLFWRRLVSSDSSVDLVNSNGASRARGAILMVFRGVDATTGLDVSPQYSFGQNDTTPSSPSITPVSANGAIVSFIGFNAGASRSVTWTGTQPSGYTLGPDSSSDRAWAAGAYLLDDGAADATGALTWSPSGINSVDENGCSTVSLRAAAGGTDATATPSAVGLATSVPAPTISSSATAAPATVSVVVEIPVPTVSAGAGASVAAPAVAVAVSVPAPAVSTDAGVNVSADTVALATTIPAPTVEATSSATAAPAVLALTTTIPAPTAGAGQGASAPSVSLAFTIPAPTIETTSDAAATPATLAVTLAVPSPTVGISETATPGAVGLTVALPAPIPSDDDGSVTVEPPVLRVFMRVFGVTPAGDAAAPAIGTSRPTGTGNLEPRTTPPERRDLYDARRIITDLEGRIEDLENP